MVQLYWDQGSFEDRFRYRLGKIDPGTLYDAGRYVSATYAFLSPAFSDTLAMPLPGSGLGAVAAVYPYGETCMMAGVHDANGAKTTTGVHTLRRGKLFAALEIGATPGFGEVGEGLYHLTLWHSDAREKTGVPSGRGLAVTAEQELGPLGKVVPWVRYSYADGGGTRVRHALAAGAGFEDPFGKPDDLAGIGLAWGQPRDAKLRDQYVAEAFYRVHLTPYTHLTPDIQWVVNPSEAPDEHAIFVLSVRLRTLF